MIRTERDGPVLKIVLARPERRNALTPEMLAGIVDGVATSPDDVGAILLCGEGPVFCAGFDLSACRDDPAGTVLSSLLTGLSRAIDALLNAPVPVVAAVQGAAIAGGCALLGGADFVIADRDAKLGYPVTRLGISPGVSLPFVAAQLTGGVARDLALDPGLRSAADAARSGLVSEVVDDAVAVHARAVALARSLAAKPRPAMTATRALLREVAGPTQAQVARGLAASLGLVGGPEERAMLPAAWTKRV